MTVGFSSICNIFDVGYYFYEMALRRNLPLLLQRLRDPNRIQWRNHHFWAAGQLKQIPVLTINNGLTGKSL